MENIIIKKLNKNYESDPNIAEPIIRLNDNTLDLSFELNHIIFNFKENQKGHIKFNSCEAFRVGGPNDEGFYLNDGFWNKKKIGEIEWNCFYEVLNTPLEYIGEFYKTKNFEVKYKSLKHYVFFMKEATFECFAESYKEII